MRLLYCNRCVGTVAAISVGSCWWDLSTVLNERVATVWYDVQ